MTSMQKNALKYVQNSNGGATRESFVEDHEPIGEILWRDLEGMIHENMDGSLWLTDKGEAAVADAA